MKEILIVIDMQPDFLDGPLGNAECAAAVGPCLDLLRRAGWEHMYFTRDTHGPDYAETHEGRCLPIPHCVAGTDGWQIAPALRPFADAPDATVIDKPAFGSPALAADLRALHGTGDGVRLHLCGVCTSICVLSNAALLRAFLPEADIVVHESATADVTPELKVHALACLRSIHCDVEP